ncbi:hypothetical protein, partial [Rubrivirga marina]|uniref:hypothetical protein n=1 Tax=Rubrivirga marina TaxID=1196024 RepID=UPI001C52FA98
MSKQLRATGEAVGVGLVDSLVRWACVLGLTGSAFARILREPAPGEDGLEEARGDLPHSRRRHLGAGLDRIRGFEEGEVGERRVAAPHEHPGAVPQARHV